MPDPTIAEVVAELRALLALAVSLPLYAEEGETCGDFRTFRLNAQVTDRGGMTPMDADLIVAAVNALPRLLALLEAAETLRRDVELADCSSRQFEAAPATYDAASGRKEQP